MTPILEVLALIATLAWLWVTVTALRGLRSLPPLPPLGAAPDTPTPGSIGVVIATRDEGENAERCVRDLLAQRGLAGLRILVVDDRSDDDTAERLARLQAEHPALRSLRIDELPPGWLGKPHACWHGALALGDDLDWLLFLDADTRLDDDVLARALRCAEQQDMAHLSLLPRLRDQTTPGRWITLTMSLGLAQQAAGLEADRSGAYFGVGAFTLIRREVYREVGGHQALRMQVIEDLMLARHVREAGYRNRLRFAVDCFSVRWITDFESASQVLEKNYFALFRFSVARYLVSYLGALGMWLLALFSYSQLEVMGTIAALALWSITLPAIGLARRYDWPWWLAPLTPFGVPFVLLAMAHSVEVTRRQGGVIWRGTLYPLEELRAAAQAGSMRR